MSDAPLPPDVPRLRTIERWLLVQLAAVRRAIELVESGKLPRGDIDQTPRWCVQWRWVPAGQPRRGVLHRADCWMATGDRLDIGQVSRARQKPGTVLEPCEVCKPTP